MEQSVKKSKAPIILGVISLVAWLIPIAGLIISIVGIVLSAKSLKQGGALPKVSLSLNILGLIITIVYFAFIFITVLNALNAL